MIQLSLVTLFIVFIFLCFILISTFLYLVVKKYEGNKMRSRIDRIKEQERLEMFHYLQTGETFLLDSELGQEKETAISELLNEYANVLDGSDVKERIRLFAEQHLSLYIKRNLKKRRWSLRMNALYLIEDFYMDHLVDMLHERYTKRRTSISEKSLILKLFATFDDNRIVEYVKTAPDEIANFSLLSVLMNMEEVKLDELITEFDVLPKRTQYLVVEAIGKRQLFKNQMLLQALILQADTELKIRSLKAYAATGLPIDANAIADFFHSENWQLRMMAIKVTGVQRLEAYRDILIELLSDREYLVRAEAAKAILRFKDGVDALTRVMEQSDDLFAKDMAMEWLEKERGGFSYV